MSAGTLVNSQSEGEKPDNGRRFVGPGHTAVIRDDNNRDWLVYHAVDASNPMLPNGATRRPLLIDPIEWKDGWPTVDKGEPSSGMRPGPGWKKGGH